MRTPVAIGSRGSRLARIQTQSVLGGLAALYPDREFRLVEIRTTGDITATTPLSEMATHGVSVKELYQLFPKAPAKTAARIAGIPKPRGCI